MNDSDYNYVHFYWAGGLPPLEARENLLRWALHLSTTKFFEHSLSCILVINIEKYLVPRVLKNIRSQVLQRVGRGMIARKNLGNLQAATDHKQDAL